MSTTEPPRVAKSSLARDLFDAYLGGRRGLIVAAALVLVAGLALNWSWLVAAGIAPLLVAVLPCAAMCALGLCMNGMAGRSCSTDENAAVAVRALEDQTIGDYDSYFD